MRPSNGQLLAAALCVAAGLLSCGAAAAADSESAGKGGEGGDRLGVVRLMLAGNAMSATRAAALESIVRANPGDLEARALLLGYYDHRKSRTVAKIRKSRIRHIVWVTRNRPGSDMAAVPDMQACRRSDDPKLRSLLIKLWNGHVKRHPRDTAILRNAANFFLACDRTRAEDILRHAETVEPGNGDWPRRLAQVYLLGTCTTEAGVKYTAGANALKALMRARRLAPTEDHKLMLLDDLARAAYFSKHYYKTKTYVRELIENVVNRDWEQGSVMNLGHTLLGLIAIELGDVKEARTHLLDSGNVRGTPHLSVVGPNMALAHALLEKQERDIVLEYFSRCAIFWTLGGTRLKAWRAAVEAGRMPEFGASLCIR